MNVQLQKKEVAGLYRTRFIDAQHLLTGQCERIQVEGFEIDAAGERREESREVDVHDFVPHEPGYYQRLFHAINQFRSQYKKHRDHHLDHDAFL